MGPKGLKTMVVEKPGNSIKSILKVGNPFPKEKCGRSECPWGKRDEACYMRCYKEGINYYAVCKICFERDLKEGIPEEDIERKVYIGETHRSLYTRRLTQLAKMNNNWMSHHNKECHREESKEWTIENKKNQFDFYPIEGYQKVLERQVVNMRTLIRLSLRGQYTVEGEK